MKLGSHSDIKYKTEKQEKLVYLGKCPQADWIKKYIQKKTLQEETLSPFLQKTEIEWVIQLLKLLIFAIFNKNYHNNTYKRRRSGVL